MIDSARLRAELERILADQARDVRDLAQRVADETWKRVEAGTPAAKAVGEAMDAAGVDEQLQQRLGRDVVQSLCAGAGILPQITAAGLVDQFAAAALVLSWDSSGMPLSSRLHSDQVKADVAHAISSAISRRDDAWRTARKIYDGYGFGGALKARSIGDLPQELQKLVEVARKSLRPQDVPGFLVDVKQATAYAKSLRTAPLRAAYTQLLSRLEKGMSAAVEHAVRVASEEKTRYFAERILRTESARAWGEGFFDQMDSDPDATGLRWETSSAHRIFDVCDFHHRADLFGMGPGVYPMEHRPSYPAHPHCLCVLSAVYRGKPRTQIELGGKRALNDMSDADRVRLLGMKGADAFANGASWRPYLRNWTEPSGIRRSSGAKKILTAAKQAVAAAPAPTVAAGGFVVPATVHDAIASIEALGMKAEIDGMSLDHAQEIARAFHHLVVTHGFPAPPGVRLVRSIGGSAVAMADASGHDGTIKLGFEAITPGGWAQSRKRANDDAAMERAAWKALPDDEKRALLKRGIPIPPRRYFVSETIFDTVVHEYGHYIHSLTFGRNQFATEQDLAGFKELSGRDPTTDRLFVQRRARSTRKVEALTRETLSEYATSNVLETFAEAFNAKYSKGERLPGRFQRVVDEVVRRANRTP